MRKFIEDIKNKILTYLLPCTIGIAIILAVTTVILQRFFNMDDIRNVLLSLGALVGIPFLVWRTQIADKTQKGSEKSFFNDRYIKAVEQLSDDKETIRIAGTYALIQLLDEANERDKNAILNVLWCFMEEHSREALILKAEINSIQENINKNRSEELEILNEKLKHSNQKIGLNNYLLKMQAYYSQFSLILPIIPKKQNQRWWKSRDLSSISLSHSDLQTLNLTNLDFSYADLSYADCDNSDFSNCDLNNTDLNNAKYNNKTKFPDGFNPQEHGMINVDDT